MYLDKVFLPLLKTCYNTVLPHAAVNTNRCLVDEFVIEADVGFVVLRLNFAHHCTRRCRFENRSSNPSLKFSNPRLKSSNLGVKFETQILKSESQILKYESQILKSKSQILKSETQIPKSKSQTLKSESQLSNLRLKSSNQGVKF